MNDKQQRRMDRNIYIYIYIWKQYKALREKIHLLSYMSHNDTENLLTCISVSSQRHLLSPLICDGWDEYNIYKEYTHFNIVTALKYKGNVFGASK